MDAVSNLQTYFPPEPIYTRFTGTKEALLENGAKSASNFNTQLLLERRNREKFFDPNTQIHQVPLGRIPFIPSPAPTMFPIALMKGQYVDSFADL